jgi:hypothetical protein
MYQVSIALYLLRAITRIDFACRGLKMVNPDRQNLDMLRLRLKFRAKFSLKINPLYTFLLEIFHKPLVIWMMKSYLCVPLLKGAGFLIEFKI